MKGNGGVVRLTSCPAVLRQPVVRDENARGFLPYFSCCCSGGLLVHCGGDMCVSGGGGDMRIGGGGGL
jgi:hypothetical protein